MERGRHVPSPHRMKDMSKEEVEKHAREAAECTSDLQSLSMRCPNDGCEPFFDHSMLSLFLKLVVRASRVSSGLGKSGADLKIWVGIQREQAKDAKKE